MPDTTREGILTESDRRYLEDPEGFIENHTRQAAHARRKKIRERIEGAVPDLVILAEQLPPEEQAKIDVTDEEWREAMTAVAQLSDVPLLDPDAMRSLAEELDAWADKIDKHKY